MPKMLLQQQQMVREDFVLHTMLHWSSKCRHAMLASAAYSTSLGWACFWPSAMLLLWTLCLHELVGGCCTK